MHVLAFMMITIPTSIAIGWRIGKRYEIKDSFDDTHWGFVMLVAVFLMGIFILIGASMGLFHVEPEDLHRNCR